MVTVLVVVQLRKTRQKKAEVEAARWRLVVPLVDLELELVVVDLIAGCTVWWRLQRKNPRQRQKVHE